jgi:mono/diheme cytochrome c family protein
MLLRTPGRRSPARALSIALALSGLSAAALSCGTKPTSTGPDPAPSASASAAAAVADKPASAVSSEPSAAVAPVGPPGDAAKGKELVAKFECNRCHDGTGQPEAKFEKQCFHCHERIMKGSFKGPNHAVTERWKEMVGSLTVAPTLTSSQKRFRRGWLQRFLQNPYDVRPHLLASMPRLPMTEDEARDIATHLALGDAEAADALAGANLERGRKLMEDKGCAACHAFTGVQKLAGAPATVDPKGAAAAVALAPDLRTTRDRMPGDVIITWIKSPKELKADTQMPEFPLPDADVRDIAAYIAKAKLEAAPAKAVPARLPVLTRKVSFDEVSTKIFRRTCWHCHGEPDYSVGDGGPGNTGGFGFRPRGLALTDYGNVSSGFLDDKGERHSAFEKLPDGTPRMLATLVTRQHEEAGKTSSEMRGMPLGYPALTPEEIQLLESWIEQGRPR